MMDDTIGGLNLYSQPKQVLEPESSEVLQPVAEDYVEPPKTKTMETDYLEKSLSDYNKQRTLLNDQIQKMIQSYDLRQNKPTLDRELAAFGAEVADSPFFATGFSKGVARMADVRSEEEKRRREDAKARLDLIKSGQELSEKQIISQLAPRLFKVDENGQFTGELDPAIAQKMVSLTGDVNIIQKVIEMTKPQIGELAPGASLYDKKKGKIILTAPTVPKESTPTDLKKTLDELSVIEENLAKDPNNKKLQQAQKVYKDKLEKFDQLEFPDEVLDMLARQALSGDTSVFVNVGRGTQGPNNLVRLRTRMSEIMKASGLAPEEIAARNAEFFGFKAGQRSLGTRGANIELASQEFLNIVPLAKQASEKVGRSKFLPFGKVEVMFNEQVNDPDLAEFAAYNNGIINTYARAISPTGVPTVSDKMHARKIITEAKDQKAYNAAINALEKEIAAAKRSPTEVRESMRKDFVKSETIPPKSQDKSTSGKAYLNNREIVVRGGKWVYADTGQEAK